VSVYTPDAFLKILYIFSISLIKKKASIRMP
jgi:hypothetical protein